MRNRTYLYLLVGVVLATVLVCSATDVAAGNSHRLSRWSAAQSKNPLLWMVDGCAFIILLGSWLYGATLESQGRAGSRHGIGTQYLDPIMARLVDLEELSREQAARIETLEDAGEDWHDGFDAEATRLTEQAFLALSDNIEANARQLDAINLALRYQRAEMKSLRSALKTGELAPEGEAPPLDLIARPPRAVVPQLKKPAKSAETIAAAEEEPEEKISEEETPPVAEETQTHTEAQAAAKEEDVEIVAAEEVWDEEGGADPASEDGDSPDETSPNVPEVETESESASDVTVNAGSSSSMDFDIEKQKKEKASADAKAAAAANEFQRSKLSPRSIFRKRP